MYRIAIRLLVVIIVLLPAFASKAQRFDVVQRGSPTKVECGTIIEGEFREEREEQTYTIDLNAGDSLNLAVTPLASQQPQTVIIVTGTSNAGIAITNDELDNGRSYSYPRLDLTPRLDTGLLPSTATYTVRVLNTSFNIYRLASDEYGILNNEASGGIGVYTLFVGCVTRGGVTINPGDIMPPEDISPVSGVAPFSGNGFPGLAPVDFGSIARIPLVLGMPMTGAITPTGGEILGYTLDANASDTFVLDFNRLSGNLNVGIVVLSAENRVVFQASLVTSSALSSTFVLPSTGTYTVGVFRIDLMPPAQPEATAFQITATLNP